jgi:hypothetical protein
MGEMAMAGGITSIVLLVFEHVHEVSNVLEA